MPDHGLHFKFKILYTEKYTYFFSISDDVTEPGGSNLPHDYVEIKESPFLTTEEDILLYRCKVWMLPTKEEFRLDGCQTCLLRVAMQDWI